MLGGFWEHAKHDFQVVEGCSIYTRVKVDGTVNYHVLVYISPVLTYLWGTVPCTLTMVYHFFSEF